ncbi:MAG: replication protein [Acidobacteriota bacterium]
MANPQVENGYTKIANEIVEALAKAMPGFTEGQIIWAILRKTYGWNKREDKISISQLQKMTGKSRRMIIYALQNLEAKRMIIIYRKRNRNSNEISTIKFNKDYDQWVVQEKTPQYTKILENRRNYYATKKKMGSARKIGVVQELEKDIQILAPTKETITKENIYSPNSQKEEKTSPIQDIFSYWNSKGIIKHRELTANLQSVINARLKKYSPEEIKEAIDNYYTILTDDKYFWTYKWTLKEFLQRGLEKFLTENKPFENYSKSETGNKKPSAYDLTMEELKKAGLR